jgi:hypothetical protein
MKTTGTLLYITNYVVSLVLHYNYPKVPTMNIVSSFRHPPYGTLHRPLRNDQHAIWFRRVIE